MQAPGKGGCMLAKASMQGSAVAGLPVFGPSRRQGDIVSPVQSSELLFVLNFVLSFIGGDVLLFYRKTVLTALCFRLKGGVLLRTSPPSLS